ncbi:hypothetical protein CCACVL1_02901 [Corchorus capsularis]|uniref:Uncharacterized protein n=1 Tax=Corchorus capsularis TaxID=210143 RepID=A0A1R3K544_COCAP|nr:hypothetical protein CCACVL1_02901 [Corchorus capsularis]
MQLRLDLADDLPGSSPPGVTHNDAILASIGKRRIMLLQHTDQGGPRQLFVIHACPLNSCGGTEKLKILVPLVDASPSLGWRVCESGARRSLLGSSPRSGHKEPGRGRDPYGLMGRRIGLPSPKPVPRELAPPEARFWSPLQIARNPLKDSWASDEKSTKAPLPLSYSAATGHQFDFNAAIFGRDPRRCRWGQWASWSLHQRFAGAKDRRHLLRKEKKGTDLCAPGKAWSPGNDGASRHEMA